MEFWLAFAVAVIVATAILMLAWRRRAISAEATLRSVASLVDGDGIGSALVGEVRARVDSTGVAEALQTAYLGAIEGASIGIALVDSSGDIQYTNPAGERLLVGDAERAVLRTRVSALSQRVGEHGHVEQIESDIHDPVRTVVTTTAVPLATDTGGVALVAIYLEDLSDRKRVDAMRTDFVANASHELKTPLGALSILAEALAQTDDEDTRARLAGRLRAEASRMANVIDDVVRLAETESLSIEFEPVEVAELVDEASEAVTALAGEKHIELVRGDIIDGTVAASREQMTSAVRNLLVNAITYTAAKEEPGTVRYSVRREGQSMCIDIQDTGIGIPDRYVDRVFERFFRVDRARSRESGGTGLGLSIVKNVALAHGGTVRLHSEVGAGSTFTICIPEAVKAPE